MSKPILSIVTIVLNDVSGLTATMRSIAQQTDVELEVVINDSRSNDGSWEVASEADIGHHKICFQSEPRGVYPAMNEAVEACSGDWVLFMNAADCFYRHDACRDLLSFVKSEDEIISSNVVEEETGNIHQYPPRDEYWRSMVFDHQGAIVRRELLEQRPFDESYSIQGDFEWFSYARTAGYNFQHLEAITAIKPFARGLSSGVLDRLPEQLRVMEKYFADYPIYERLDFEVRAFTGLASVDEAFSYLGLELPSRQQIGVNPFGPS